MQPKAFLFDLDGVLTDTAEYHYEAWKELSNELGLNFTKDDNERLKGVSRQRSFEIILEINNCQNKFTEKQKAYYADKKNECYCQLLRQLTPNDILPGISDFLLQAKQKGIKLAVASASKNAKTVIQLLGIESQFDYIADSAKIKLAKPNPEIFLNCASALGFMPQECVGFEDAQAGIEAIHSAGMLSVGINVTVTSIQPDLYLSSTSELDIDTILLKYNLIYK